MTGRPHVDLMYQALDLTAGIEKLVAAVAAEYGLSPQHANLLELLDPDADPVPLKEVAGRLHCDPSNVTLLSANLEELGLARRAPHPGDGRVRTLVLTARGRTARDEILDAIEERSPFRALGERDRQQLRRLLTRTLSKP